MLGDAILENGELIPDDLTLAEIWIDRMAPIVRYVQGATLVAPQLVGFLQVRTTSEA